MTDVFMHLCGEMARYNKIHSETGLDGIFY